MVARQGATSACPHYCRPLLVIAGAFEVGNGAKARPMLSPNIAEIIPAVNNTSPGRCRMTARAVLIVDAAAAAAVAFPPPATRLWLGIGSAPAEVV